MKIKDVAVIMCTYNGDKIEHLSRAIESVLLQREVRARIYLHVDGKPNEELAELIKEKRHQLYKVVVSEANVGLAKGLNKLISVLEDEEYIFRMDADDVSDLNRLSLQLKFMELNLDIDACGGSIAEFLGEENNVVFRRSYPLDNEGVVKQIHKASPFAHVTMCFRRSLFSKCGIYPTEYHLNEDIAYWFQCVKEGARFANLNETLVYVRMDSAYGRRTLKKAVPEFVVYAKIAAWKRVLPIWAMARFMFRLMPSWIVAYYYKNAIRNRVLNR